jgi:hypothetical protein
MWGGVISLKCATSCGPNSYKGGVIWGFYFLHFDSIGSTLLALVALVHWLSTSNPFRTIFWLLHFSFGHPRYPVLFALLFRCLHTLLMNRLRLTHTCPTQAPIKSMSTFEHFSFSSHYLDFLHFVPESYDGEMEVQEVWTLPCGVLQLKSCWSTY